MLSTYISWLLARLYLTWVFGHIIYWMLFDCRGDDIPMTEAEEYLTWVFGHILNVL